MQQFDLKAHEVTGSLRIDAKYHLTHHHPILSRIKQGFWKTQSVRNSLGEAAVWMPNRFTRVWAASREFGKPILSPYDNFRYEPWSESYLSETQVKQYPSSEVTRGMLLIVRSGRNCGPVTMVDRYTEQFTVSDDMVRVMLKGDLDDFYLYAFLSSPTGQDLLRRDRNGSVIDHIGPDQVGVFEYPVLREEIAALAAKRFRSAFVKRELARLTLSRIKEQFREVFGLSIRHPRSILTSSRRFTINISELKNRIDAEPRSPDYEAIRKSLWDLGGRTLSSIADIKRPPGRYKTNYVDSAQYGVPLMSGRHVAQYRPIALRFMNISHFKNPESFLLNAGTTLLTADGRAEENLADCAMVTSDRDSWGASGHVHRVIPKPDVHPGLVYLACSSATVQSQLKALATGSVVDALSEEDVGSVIVPYATTPEVLRLADRAKRAWDLFAKSNALEDEAIALIEAELAS